MSQVIVLDISVPEEIAVYRSHQFHSNTELEQDKRNQHSAKNGRRRACAQQIIEDERYHQKGKATHQMQFC